jgi:hypothetical protein
MKEVLARGRWDSEHEPDTSDVESNSLSREAENLSTDSFNPHSIEEGRQSSDSIDSVAAKDHPKKRQKSV